MPDRPPTPPFTTQTALQKVRIAENAWNGRDPARVALAYTPDSQWRNRAEFLLAIKLMLARTDAYFLSGRRVCLVGTIALVDARDHFAERVRGYFAEWIAALAAALVRAGHSSPEAALLAEDAVAGVQGALVLARALSDEGAFSRALARIGARLA